MIDFFFFFAVINKLKSLVKLPKSFRKHGEETQISEDIAKKIQKSSYEKTHLIQEDNFTPPYKELAQQLQATNDQIFRAAIFNLTNIALSRKQYTAAIIEILEKSLEDKIRTKEQLDYIRSKLMQIKQIK